MTECCWAELKSRKQVFDLFTDGMNSLFHRLKPWNYWPCKYAPRRKRGGRRPFCVAKCFDLLTAQDGAVAKGNFRLRKSWPWCGGIAALQSKVLWTLCGCRRQLLKSKSHDCMDSTRKNTDCARWHSCEATIVYESHDYCFPNLSAYKFLELIKWKSNFYLWCLLS